MLSPRIVESWGCRLLASLPEETEVTAPAFASPGPLSEREKGVRVPPSAGVSRHRRLGDHCTTTRSIGNECERTVRLATRVGKDAGSRHGGKTRSTMPTAPSTIFCRAAMTACLLATKHRLSDLGRVGKMGETRLIDLHARLGQPLLELLAQGPGNLVDVAAKGDLGLFSFAVIVRVGRGKMPQRGLALHAHIGLEVVNVEHRPGGIAHVPHDDGRDLHRVAGPVVDLESLAIQGPRSQGHLVAVLAVVRLGAPGSCRLFYHHLPWPAGPFDKKGFAQRKPTWRVVPR